MDKNGIMGVVWGKMEYKTLKRGECMELKGKTVAVLVEDLYQDMEVWYPIYRLREAGAKVITVGTGTKKTYTGKYGYPVNADTEASKVKVK